MGGGSGGGESGGGGRQWGGGSRGGDSGGEAMEGGSGGSQWGWWQWGLGGEIREICVGMLVPIKVDVGLIAVEWDKLRRRI